MSNEDLFIVLVLASIVAKRPYPIQDAKVWLESVRQVLKELK